MKICLISEGKSIHTQRWASGLAKSECDVHLVSASKVVIPGVKVYHQPIYSHNPFQQVINNFRIKRLFDVLNPDIFHIFGLFAVSSIGTMILLRKLDNLVISVWGSDVVSVSDRESYKDIYIKKYLLNKADLLVSVSKYLRQETQKYLFKQKEVKIVPWGVNLDHFYPKSKRRSREVIKFGFAKKLHLLSGPDIALKAFKYAIKKTNKKLLLRIAGDGPMKSYLKSEAVKMGIANQIEWLGWLKSTRELMEFYQSIDIFLMPSRRESFGVAAVEASASGLPIIASEFGGIPEIVIDKKSGFLADPGDVKGLGEAMVVLVENDDLRARMGDNAHKIAVNNYDWNLCVDQMIRNYECLKNGKNFVKKLR